MSQWFKEPDGKFYFSEILLGLEYLHSQQVWREMVWLWWIWKGSMTCRNFYVQTTFFLATSFEWAQSWGGDFIRMENNLLFINLLAIYICIYIYAMIYIYIDKYTHTNSRFCCKWIRYGSMMWQFFPTSWQTVLWKNWSPIECVPVCHGLWFS